MGAMLLLWLGIVASAQETPPESAPAAEPEEIEGSESPSLAEEPDLSAAECRGISAVLAVEGEPVDLSREDVDTALGCERRILSGADVGRIKQFLEQLDGSSVAIAEAEEEQEPAEESVTPDVEAHQGVSLLDGYALFVDGRPRRVLDGSGVRVVQVIAEGGEVVWSGLIADSASVPAEYVAPPEPAPPSPPEQVALGEVKQLIAQRAFDEATRLALEYAMKFPEERAVFEGLSKYAMIERRAEVKARPRNSSVARQDPRSGILLGFTVGAPTGLMVEGKIRGKALDAVGVFAGVNPARTDGMTTSPAVSVYVDWNIAKRMQLRVSPLGLSPGRFGDWLPQVGVGLQWDFWGPAEITAGFEVGSSAASPVVAVGASW